MHDEPSPLGHFDPGVFRFVGRFLEWFTGWYYRFRLRGTEHLPEGPCLIVGNHSGLGIADVVCLLGGWYAAFGLGRRCTGMMADSFIRAPLVGRLFRAFGAVPAAPANARAAFDAGHDVVAYPGGELDACRPFYEARSVVFGPRRGYVRLALERGVPIVPLATIGSAWTMPMLPGGYAVARWIGARRLLRNERFPLPLNAVAAALALVAGLAGLLPLWLAGALAPLLFLPWPARVTSELQPPIDVVSATAGIADPAERVEAAHRLVHGALSRAVLRLEHEPRAAAAAPRLSRASVA